MIRSLRTGVTGLVGHQTRMDTIGNNIANVNTVSFKRSRAAFKEVLGQQLTTARAHLPGVNSSFIGFGVTVGSVKQNWAQGAFERTNIPTDLALNGDGFFIARDGELSRITRDGGFDFDDSGTLVTSSGLPIMGYEVTDGTVDTSQLGTIDINFSALSSPKYTENISVAGNITSDAVENDEVQISRVIYDEQGTPHTVVMTLTKTANDNEWGYSIEYSGTEDPVPFATVNGTATFNSEGALAPAPDIELTWDGTYVDGSPTIDFDISDLTQYNGSNTATIRNQDGFTFGTLLGYSIDPEGMLKLNFSNGEERSTHQLAIGTVANPNGLDNLGQNYYGLTADSGELLLSRSGVDTKTTVVAGALEMSNVDLAQEFTDMIVAQRGYQASARVITTSDEILQETMSLKR